MNRGLNLTICLELDPLLCTRLSVCGMSERSLPLLGRSLRITTAPDGACFAGKIYHCSADLEGELLALALTCSDVAELCGGEHSASGRWRLDRAAFLRAAAQVVHTYRGQLWPAESTHG